MIHAFVVYQLTGYSVNRTIRSKFILLHLFLTNSNRVVKNDRFCRYSSANLGMILAVQWINESVELLSNDLFVFCRGGRLRLVPHPLYSVIQNVVVWEK